MESADASIRFWKVIFGIRTLLSLLQEQQHEIGRDLAALVQPADQSMAQTHLQEETPEDDEDEYDPEQGGMDF